MSNRESESAEKVIIKKEALDKFIKFAIKFTLGEHPREVYSLLIGKVENKIVYVEDISEITPGGVTDVKFKDKDYIKAADINEEASKIGLFVVGWAHSHPGLGIFFSQTDKENQFGFQSINPFAIGIVFDPTIYKIDNNKLTEKNFGVLKLSDINKEIESDYETVKFELESQLKPTASKIRVVIKSEVSIRITEDLSGIPAQKLKSPQYITGKKDKEGNYILEELTEKPEKGKYYVGIYYKLNKELDRENERERKKIKEDFERVKEGYRIEPSIILICMPTKGTYSSTNAFLLSDNKLIPIENLSYEPAKHTATFKI